MKAAESKSKSNAAKSIDSFFAKEGGQSFFSSPKKSNVVQRKVHVGKPNDHFEREADEVADRVVQRQTETSHKSDPKPVADQNAITPIANNSVTHPVATNKLVENTEKQELMEKEELPRDAERVQKKPIFESRAEPPDDDKNIQRLEAGNESTNASEDSGASVEKGLNDTAGRGAPLPERTKNEMESGFNRDFTDVRIHDNNDSARLSNQLNAQAFAYGNNIYFNSGKYNTSSTAGKHLLAHELTHTVQQTGGVHKMVQKKNGGGKAGAGSIDFATSTITLPVLNMPQVKNRDDNSLLNPPLTYPKGYKRKHSYKDVEDESSAEAQREVWKKASEAEVKKKVDDKIKAVTGKNAYDGTTGAYYFKHKNRDELRLIGKPETISQSSVIPTWNKAGKANAFDVDHVKELQLGGANFHTNMELLNFSFNRAAGNAVKNEIDDKIRGFIEAEEKKNSPEFLDSKFPKNTDKAKEQFSITFQSVTFNNKPQTKGSDHFWSIKEIGAGKQVDDFEPMSAKEIKKVQGEKGKEIVYTSPSGGVGLSRADIKAFNKGKNIKFSEPTFDDQTGKAPGTKVGGFDVEFALYGSAEERKKFNIPIYQMEGVLFGGHIPRRGQSGGGGLEQMLVGLDIPGMSPIIVETAELVADKGLQVRGKIKPTLEVIKGIDIDFYIDGGDFGLSKTFSSGEIKVPSPFKINDASITIKAGTDGFGVEGDVLFEIEKLGKGKISGTAKTDGKFGIKGYFEFDKKLFSGGAKIEVEYDNVNFWKIKGELGIKKGTVKGINSAKITVTYESNVLEAKGVAEVALKGVKEVTLGIKFTDQVTEITGGIKLDKLPGIKDGEGELKVVKQGDDYDFSGKGKITPDIPGISSQVAFEFHNDIFLVDAKIAFEKDRLKGDLNIGVTNRAIDPATGQPTGEALPDYKVYGSSELSLKITDSITVIAGVKLLENGEIEVKGGIKLPPKVEVVPKLFSVEDKPLIEIPEISFPLFGIPLGVTTLGLEATISPYIQASAQVGPGYLTNTQAEVTYNPSHPEQMSITGSADFELVAEASIHAGVDFAVGISIGIAGASGGINLDAYVKVAAQQPIFHADVKYSPATGFELNGNVKAIVAAILGFGGKLFLKLRAGVWPLKKTWKWDKELFKKEIDTGLQIGFEFPFAYKNGQADISFDKMKFVYPKLDGTFIKSMSDKIVKPVVDSLL